ncbi:hypothetical protein EVAR_82211_1 [Eumeta japonica]|uniref:Uncharacterized protein n=1 Tax=Eumeta variegata TaxID=151549 RepID=A0A4C1W6N8_EUMVA|nr:hypothetical protein EVAR_82211_1 [Eumeta japonica]
MQHGWFTGKMKLSNNFQLKRQKSILGRRRAEQRRSESEREADVYFGRTEIGIVIDIEIESGTGTGAENGTRIDMDNMILIEIKIDSKSGDIEDEEIRSNLCLQK